MDIFALVAKLTLDKSNYDAGLDDAAKGAQTFGDKLKQGLGTAAKVGATAIAAVGTAAAAATTALVKQAGEVASYGDNIDKASQKLGISAEAYQEWDAVLQHSGTSIDSMGIGMKTLATQAAKGSDAFETLGISTEKAASMSREDLFAETITALQNVTDENQRAQLAQELFGRSAMELGPLLNTSAADTQAMKDRVHELGGVMSNEAVKAAAAYQDNLQDMTTAMDGVKRNIVSEFIPGLSSLMAAFTDILAGDDPGEALEQGIDSIVGAMDSTVQRIVNIGQRVVPALVDAIVKAAPGLLDGAAQLVLTLGEAIIVNLPELVRAGLQVIVTLANAIAASLPELIPTIVSVVMEIVEILTEPSTLSALIDASLAIIIALAEGLINSLPRLLEKAPIIIAQMVAAIIALAQQLLQAALQLMATFAQGIVHGISSVISAIGQLGSQIFSGIGGIVSKAWQWGADLINNFTEGLKAFLSKPIDAVKGLASKIKSFLGFSEPEEGPLSNFHTYAPDMMQLFAKGITDNRGLITDAIGSAFNVGGQIAGNAGTGGDTFTVPRSSPAPRMMTVIFQMNDTEVGRVLTPIIEAEQQRYGMKLSTGGAL